MIEWVYQYAAKTRAGKTVDGLVFARNREDAILRVTQIGHQPFDIGLSLDASFQSLWRRDIDRRELARFYTTLGKRLGHGGNIVAGIGQALDFVADPRLKTALNILRAAVNDGAKLAEAMSLAGFPGKDAAAVAALEKAGKLPDIFIALGEEAARNYRLESNIKATIRTPVFFFGLVFVLFYATLVWVAPRMSHFFKQMEGIKLPAFAQHFYDFAAVFNAHLIAASAGYLALGVAATMFARSLTFKALLNRINTFSRLSERSDMSTLWSGYALLYNAGVHIATAARMMAAAAHRADSRSSFENLANALTTGMPLDAAVLHAGFPVYVSNAVSAAVSSGDVYGGLHNLAVELMEDVYILSEQLKEVVKHAMIYIMALVLLLFFLATYYPLVSSILSQV